MNEEFEPTEEDLINEALGENPRARELRLMRAALEERRNGLRKEADLPGADTPRRISKLRELDKQIEALHREEAIAEFVENSVRVTLSKSAAQHGQHDFTDDEAE